MMESWGMSHSKLLIVDDVDLSRLATCLLVESMGYQVDQAKCCDEALAKLESNEYCCIVMDYQMPEHSGCDCSAFIRTRFNWPIPIVCYTGSKDPQVFDLALASGMNACLSRDCPKEELADTLRSLVTIGRDILPL